MVPSLHEDTVTIRKITQDDAEYPKQLKSIHKPPQQLYVNGSFQSQDNVAIAIVGSRRASRYGLEMSEKLAFDLAIRGVTVVSGMARGIDTAAHRGALKAKGRTIAVMGSGHNHIYPTENEKLYHEIAASGAVVTEFEPDIGPFPYNFPQRNRIISGLSLGLVVVEAAKDSGALITADLATEQGREVFAVPGAISSTTSSGTNSLIKDGAKLIQSVDDILDELFIHEIKPVSGDEKEKLDTSISKMTESYVYNSLTEDERKIYKELSDQPIYIDDLIGRAGFDTAKASKVLLSLQLKKLIQEVPGKHYVRKEV
jgi:DNA protecting protein DprA